MFWKILKQAAGYVRIFECGISILIKNVLDFVLGLPWIRYQFNTKKD